MLKQEKSISQNYDTQSILQPYYSTILENSNDMIIACDSDRKIIFWNHSAQVVFGYSAEEAIGEDLILMVPEKYRARHTKAFKRFIQSGKLKQRKLYEVEGLKKDRTLFPLELSLSSHESNGKYFVTAIMRDITERKYSEEQIRKQIDRLTALRNIDMAITASLDLRITFDVFIEQVADTLAADAVDLLLFNPHTLRFEYLRGKGFGTKALQHTNLRINEGYAGRAALDGRILYIPDLREDAGDFARSPLLLKENFIVYCCAPLISKGSIKGVLEIFYRRVFDVDTDFLNFLEALSLQAAIAIDNISMFNDMQRAHIDLTLAYDTTIEGWSHALDLRDRETEGHSQRVAEMTVRVGRAMGLGEKELANMRRGALLHDIGKMGIPDAILLKPEKLTEKEWEVMKKHPVYAYELLSPIAYIRSAIDIPYCHHEKWGGSGYPRGIKGEEIPLSARIFAVVDTWDALSKDRPYRLAWDKEKIREHIRSLAGKDFDPKVVDVFLNIDW